MSSISALGESWPSRNGRMERNFPVFRFSGILGQIREIRPKFRNEIPEKDCSIRSPHPEFPEYLVEWKASCHHAKDFGYFGRNSNGKVRFGFFRPEYIGSPLEVVHFERRNIPTEIRRSILVSQISDILVRIQMERSVSVSSDRNISDHLWRWSTLNVGIFRPKFAVPF